jgi:WD40 repeat protein
LQASVQSARIRRPLMDHPGNTVRSVAFSADGSKIFAGFKDGSTRVWKTNQQDPPQTPKDHAGAIKIASCQDDSRTANSEGREIVIRDAKGTLIRAFDAGPGGTKDLDFSPDCNRLAAGGADGSWTLWYLTDRRVRPARHNGISADEAGRALLPANRLHHPSPPLPYYDEIDGIAFSPDGELVATASKDRTVKLWQADDGKLLLTLVGHVAGVRSVKFSPDGLRLATASSDNTVKIWDVVSGRPLLTLAGHAHSVVTLDFNPDGNLLVTGGEDGAAKVWDVAPGHTDEVYALAFSPDGRTLATAGRDGQALLWKVPSENEYLRDFYSFRLQGHFATKVRR